MNTRKLGIAETILSFNEHGSKVDPAIERATRIGALTMLEIDPGYAALVLVDGLPSWSDTQLVEACILAGIPDGKIVNTLLMTADWSPERIAQTLSHIHWPDVRIVKAIFEGMHRSRDGVGEFLKAAKWPLARILTAAQEAGIWVVAERLLGGLTSALLVEVGFAAENRDGVVVVNKLQ